MSGFFLSTLAYLSRFRSRIVVLALESLRVGCLSRWWIAGNFISRQAMNDPSNQRIWEIWLVLSWFFSSCVVSHSSDQRHRDGLTWSAYNFSSNSGLTSWRKSYTPLNCSCLSGWWFKLLSTTDLYLSFASGSYRKNFGKQCSHNRKSTIFTNHSPSKLTITSLPTTISPLSNSSTTNATGMGASRSSAPLLGCPARFGSSKLPRLCSPEGPCVGWPWSM